MRTLPFLMNLTAIRPRPAKLLCRRQYAAGRHFHHLRRRCHDQRLDSCRYSDVKDAGRFAWRSVFAVWSVGKEYFIAPCRRVGRKFIMPWTHHGEVVVREGPSSQGLRPALIHRVRLSIARRSPNRKVSGEAWGAGGIRLRPGRL